jgi:hypothetical protein
LVYVKTTNEFSYLISRLRMDLAKQNVKLLPMSREKLFSHIRLVCKRKSTKNLLSKCRPESNFEKILLNNYKPATSKSTSKIGLKVQLFRQHLLKN